MSRRFDDVDYVNHPPHYQKGDLEVIEIIENVVPDPYSYCFGNSLKYLCRHMDKGNQVQDLEKAKWYIDRMIGDWTND